MADKIPRTAATPQLRLVWLLLIALLLVAVAATAAVVGSRLLKSNVPDDGLSDTAVIPQGGSAVFAFASVGGDSNGQTSGDIYTVQADGTNLRRLTSGPGMSSGPVWSPDGRRIAFRTWQTGTASLVVMDAGGGDRKTLATNQETSNDCMDQWNLAWSPDGKRLLFPTRDGCTGAFDINIVAADGSSPATKLVAPGTSSVLATWSPDGKQIAFLGSAATGSNGLYVVDVGSGGGPSGGLQPRRIGPVLGPNPGDGSIGGPAVGIHDGPQWSPDGKELAVVVNSKGIFLVEAEGIYIVNADGSGQRLLAARAGNPSWSPDGRRLAFHRTVDEAEYFDGRPCTVRTWIIDADGKNERRLDPLGDGCDAPPRWSPDGTRIQGSFIATTPADPKLGFHLGFVTVDGSSPAVILQDGPSGRWQPVVAPLPAAPSFPAVSPTP